MREHIFRGKRIDRDEWIYGSYVKASCSHYIYNVLNKMINIDPKTVGEGSNKFDRKGKRIFEHDILTCPDIKGYEPCVVKFGDHRDAYNGWYVEWANGLQAELNSSWAHSGEIIGNLTDNPELLEVQ